MRRRTKTKTWLREVLQHDALHVPFEPQKIRLLVTHSQPAAVPTRVPAALTVALAVAVAQVTVAVGGRSKSRTLG